MNDLGQTVTLSLNPTNIYGDDVEVAGLAVVVTQPDTTTTVPVAPVEAVVGTYQFSFVPSQSGRHLITWSATGFSYTDVFNVALPDPRMMFGIAEALDIVGNVRNPEDLRLYIAATTAVIEDIVGPIVTRTFTETLQPRSDYSGRTTFSLSNVPVVAVTSITADQQGLYEPPVSDVVVDSVTGTVLLADYQAFYGPVVIQYTAGRAVIPANILLAAKEEFRFLWQIGRQGPRAGSTGTAIDDTAWSPSGYAVPRRVIELLAPHRRPAGIA